MHQLNGYTITQVFGERDAYDRHSNLGSITTISYLSSKQLMEQLDTLDITATKREQLAKDYANAKGGAIRLFITRFSESRANFRWFFIVIQSFPKNHWTKWMLYRPSYTGYCQSNV